VIADAVWRVREGRTRILLQLAAAGGPWPPRRSRRSGAAYLRVRADYHQVRDISEGRRQRRPTCESYLVGKDSIGVWRWLPTAVGVDPEKELFARSVRGEPGRTRVLERRPPIRGAGVGPSSTARIAITALVLSLGPHVRIWGTVVTTHGPYAWLLAIVPA